MAFIFHGGDGNDSLLGGGGNDTFAFTAGETGHDVVQNFQVHGASAQGDTILLKGFADATFDQAVADGDIAQFGNDVHISDGAHLVATLADVSLASLHAQDFLFV
jgi:Ca2+-binding RTX toxin-like protein